MEAANRIRPWAGSRRLCPRTASASAERSDLSIMRNRGETGQPHPCASAPAAGLEPATVRLTVECSAIELRGIANTKTLAAAADRRQSHCGALHHRDLRRPAAALRFALETARRHVEEASPLSGASGPDPRISASGTGPSASVSTAFAGDAASALVAACAFVAARALVAASAFVAGAAADGCSAPPLGEFEDASAELSPTPASLGFASRTEAPGNSSTPDGVRLALRSG